MDKLVLTHAPTTTQFVTKDSGALFQINATTPSPTEEAYKDLLTNSTIRIILITIHIICSIFAILGNSIVLLVIYKRKSLRRNTTVIFIINLAIVDLILCLFYRPLVLVRLILPFTGSSHDYYYSATYCKTTAYFQGMFAAVLYHTIVAISQERLLLIVYPLKAKQCCSSSRAHKIIIFLWLLAAVLVLPVPLKFIRSIEVTTHGHVVRYCGNFTHTADGYVYFTFILLMYYIIPFIMVVISYIRIFFALYHRPKNLKGIHEKKDAKSLQARRSLAKMMLSIAVIFSICWGPNFCYHFFVGIGGDVPSDAFFIGAIVDILPIMGSALNPFVYTINSKTFRRGFTNMVREASGKRKSNSDTPNTFIGFNRQSSRSMNNEKIGDNEKTKSLIGNRVKGDAML